MPHAETLRQLLLRSRLLDSVKLSTEHIFLMPIRELEVADLPAATQILSEGFPRLSADYWARCLKLIGDRDRAPDTPQFGYGLEDNGLQGVALAIGSLHGSPDNPQTIVNISSWTVRQTHRGPVARELFNHASSVDPRFTYSDLSAAEHTIKRITPLGFRGRTAGQIVAIGLRASKARVLTVQEAGRAGLPNQKSEMLSYHESHGCICFCLALRDRVAPLIFLPRKIKGLLPLAQLIYCEQMDDFLDHSRAIYRGLLFRGFPAILIDASGPMPGLKGRYFAGRQAKYYKGRFPEYAVDHTYSEMIYIGF